MVVNDWTWLIIAVILVLLFIGGIWFAYQISRRERQASALRRRDLDYRPQDSSTGAFLDHLSTSTDESVRWGDGLPLHEAQTTAAETGRIRWGDAWEWVEVSPASDATADETLMKCPVCKRKISGDQDAVFTCPQCQTVYHQACKSEYSGPCLICRE